MILDLNLLIGRFELTANEKKVLQYLVNNVSEIEDQTLKEISSQVYSSPATIVRLCKKLGFKGYVDFYFYLSHQLIEKNRPTHFSSHLSQGKLSLELANYTEDYAQTISQICQQLYECRPKNILICGSGFSGLVGYYLYKKLMAKGLPAIFSGGDDSSGMIERQGQHIGFCIAVSKSGETDTVIKKARFCQSKGIPTLVISGNAKSRLNEIGDYQFIVDDDLPLDSQNLNYNTFFVGLMYLFENLANCDETCFLQ